MPRDQISAHIALLQIRQKARRRDALLTGAVFLIAILATVGMGLLGALRGRELYLLMGLLVAFGVSFLMIWVRLENIKSAIELAEALQRELHSRA